MSYEKFKRPILSERHIWPDDRGVIQGWWDYNDTATQSVPLTVLPSTWKKLTNDGLGAQSSSAYCLPYVPYVFDTADNQFDFSSLEIGDTVDIRVAALITTSVNNQSNRLSFFGGVGTAYEYQIPFVPEVSFKNHAEHMLGGQATVYIGNALTRDNPAEIRVWSDGDATIKVDGWFVRVLALKRRE